MRCIKISVGDIENGYHREITAVSIQILKEQAKLAHLELVISCISHQKRNCEQDQECK